MSRYETLRYESVLRQFEITPKAFANSSPGLERQRQPWDHKSKVDLNPERVPLEANPFRVWSQFE
jgi:hypothetical protein